MEKQFYCVHDWMTRELGLRGNERDVFAVIYSFSESGGVFTGGLKDKGSIVALAQSGRIIGIVGCQRRDVMFGNELHFNGTPFQGVVPVL